MRLRIGMFRFGAPSRDAHTLPDDHTIVTGIRAGQSDIFSACFLYYYDTLCRFAAGYTDQWEDAEDIVENVFARIWERHAAFTPIGGVAPYLFSAVRNRALNARRDSKTREDIVLEKGSPLQSPYVPLADEQLEHHELGDVLATAINQLPERRRAVIMMRWFGGLSHADIASVLGVSPNAVEIQLRRALQDLATLMPQAFRPD